MTIYAISGFLGLPSDWDFLPWPQVRAVDWQAFPWNSLTDWGSKFNDFVAQQKHEKNLLMGYSLGGRLALHALIQRPQLWHGAILISAHPGLTDLNEKSKRLERDQIWAERFQTENWIDLMQAWNGQEVFSHDVWSFNRQEVDYQRDQLIKAFLYGSLGQQRDLRQEISELLMPILWITGRKDQYYSQMAQALRFSHSLSCSRQIEEAGHRVPWVQPFVFTQTVHQIFFDKLNLL